MKTPEWFHDPRIQDIAPAKLTLLLKLAEQAMPILLGAVASASRQNLQFSKDEFDLIFEIMKEGKSESEKRQMDETLKRAQKALQGKR